MRFGAILRKTRLNAGFSQEKLAERLHMSRSCISKLENDKKTLDAATMIRWFQNTQAHDALVALVYQVDIASVAQNVASLIS
ncbi:helix-turn-helix domain-containing protein [Metabacillus fastidiosus]|uniref:helix-turn-helix domain-containing protein n=1 Tax=Metabacillus fastidiosus TaxID=1458 RepID=UPI0008255A67|nr:helix-turn-helix transcriptional regulator [Metabacillus fastidiosus]MED4461821.1 helix-turn-helix transcriptional regulator [Metabacillus fastidiosus]